MDIKQRNRLSRWKSTKGWIGTFKKRNETHEAYLEKLEATARQSQKSYSDENDVINEPINIMCLDGGGALGMYLLVVLLSYNKEEVFCCTQVS